MPIDEDHSIWSQYYCTDCQEIVGISPHDHRDEEHDGDPMTDIYRITDEQDGHLLAKDDGMGHFTPHIWSEVDGVQVCSECGAVKLDVAVDDLPEEIR